MDLVKIRKQLELHEGVRDKLYIDTEGHPTIGIGHNLDLPISDHAVTVIFEDDLLPKWIALQKALPWIKDLDEVRQHVLLDMAFNMGVQSLLEFRQTLSAVKAGDYSTAASLMLQSKWAMEVKSRAVRLSKMMRTGQYPEELGGPS